ncbi:phage tail protein [Nocardioides hwasunensis]|uniref:Phage tail protein n=1 Tax=Nocardioides hwasunensis TaxID=397258 RepID=A0ABR8MGX4_9ACTN|nr:tail fiber protein [Nocardioides hwasunensis]MBD3915327.1 phage tail protein [Nocardioides hwasunensis]
MTDPFLAEIRAFAGGYAPQGWALCNGQLMPISQNTALFSLLGITYGGDGRSTFALPNLQGRAPVQHGQGPGLSQYVLGQQAGSATHTLVQAEMPAHSHAVQATTGAGTSSDPADAIFATSRYGRVATNLYSTTGSPAATMRPDAVVPTGGGQPHNNRPPYLVLSFIIALQGIFPQRP